MFIKQSKIHLWTDVLSRIQMRSRAGDRDYEVVIEKCGCRIYHLMRNAK